MPEEGDPGSNTPPRSIGDHSSSYQKPFFHRFWCALKRVLGLKDCEGSYKEALQEVLEEHAEELGRHSPEEGRILSNLIDFGELEVSDIMTPQTDIIAVEITANLLQLRDVMVKEQHTRLPVYEGTLDSIQGFIHVKDLIPMFGMGEGNFEIRKVMRQILFVPPGMKLASLLVKMRMSGVHIAIVVDEYGGTIGLVTLEDLFEEIVGDIQDEHDDENENHLRWDNRNSLVVDAKIRIEDLEEQLGLKLGDDEEEDYDTLAGLIFSQLGRVPAKGESTHHPSGLRIDILDADTRSIKRVRLVRVQETSNAKKIAV